MYVLSAAWNCNAVLIVSTSSSSIVPISFCNINVLAKVMFVELLCSSLLILHSSFSLQFKWWEIKWSHSKLVSIILFSPPACNMQHHACGLSEQAPWSSAKHIVGMQIALLLITTLTYSVVVLIDIVGWPTTCILRLLLRWSITSAGKGMFCLSKWGSLNVWHSRWPMRHDSRNRPVSVILLLRRSTLDSGWAMIRLHCHRLKTPSSSWAFLTMILEIMLSGCSPFFLTCRVFCYCCFCLILRKWEAQSSPSHSALCSACCSTCYSAK